MNAGRWVDGSDRRSLDDFLDSILNIPDFIKCRPIDHQFKLYWFSITEWARDESGGLELNASTSGYIDRPDSESLAILMENKR